jgi:hypothetical protein
MKKEVSGQRLEAQGRGYQELGLRVRGSMAVGLTAHGLWATQKAGREQSRSRPRTKKNRAEGLRRGGRELSRSRLAEGLEGKAVGLRR